MSLCEKVDYLVGFLLAPVSLVLVTPFQVVKLFISVVVVLFLNWRNWFHSLTTVPCAGVRRQQLSRFDRLPVNILRATSIISSTFILPCPVLQTHLCQSAIHGESHGFVLGYSPLSRFSLLFVDSSLSISLNVEDVGSVETTVLPVPARWRQNHATQAERLASVWIKSSLL